MRNFQGIVFIKKKKNIEVDFQIFISVSLNYFLLACMNEFI